MDFKNATIKYFDDADGTKKIGILVTYPPNEKGEVTSLSVPIAEGNTDYKDIMEWVAEGNTIEEAD
tara:strand:- start:45 stop:242 length:198 start_codon:yes stop_codon:yes gene_type:complete